MVKFAGVRNHIVGAFTAADLEACADLNLPCAGVSGYLAEPLDHGEDAGAFGTHDYLVGCAAGSAWSRVCWRAARQGPPIELAAALACARPPAGPSAVGAAGAWHCRACR